MIIFGIMFYKKDNTLPGNEKIKKDVISFRGSKYVQSRTNTVYRTVKEYLDEGKQVLFSGTPCQVSGLNAFLGKKYDNLITVDIVCHGIPSPLFFADYIEYIKSLYSSEIKSIDLQYKCNS